MVDPPVGEAALWRAWTRRLWGDVPLRTTDGQSLQVVYPGHRRGGPGPDFQGAIIVRGPAGRVEHGDVEVHLRSSGWHTHGHDRNQDYAGVILHVVLIDDGGEGEPPRRGDGAVLPTLALAPYLAPGLLEADLSSVGEEEAPPGPCRVAPGLAGRRLLDLLEAAGRTRVLAKAAALEGDLVALSHEQAGQVLFRGLLDAAGYSRNRVPCRVLAERIPIATLQALCVRRWPLDALALSQAVLLGMAGLLPAGDEHARRIWEESRPLWLGPPLRREDWHVAAVRPPNRPEARLRGIAAVVARSATVGLATTLLAPLRDATIPPHKAVAAMMSTLVVHGTAGGGTAQASLGTERAREMLANVVLPFALAWADAYDEAALGATALAALTALPGTGLNEPLSVMQEILAPAGSPPGIRVERLSSLQQQGLLHLHARYCSLHDCPDCPLAQPVA
jgi:hypothetical protein